MKKVFIVSFLILLTLGSVWANGQQESKSEEQTVLNYWTWYPGEATIREALDAFEMQNPSVKVELTVFESQAYQERLPLALASGEELDVFGVQTGVMAPQVKSYLEPLDSYFEAMDGAEWESQFNELDLDIARGQTESDELLFITAGRLGSAIALYNAKMFDDLGLSVPNTYEEMKAVAATIRKELPGVLPVVFTGDGWFVDEMLLTVVAQESDLFNEIRYDGGRFDDPRFVQALSDFKLMFQDGVFENMTDISYGRSLELFDTGKAAILYQGTWEAARLSSTFREKSGIALENVGAMAMPVMRDSGKATLRAYTELGYGISNSSSNKDAAAKLVHFLTAGEGFEIMNQGMFLIPNNKRAQMPDSLFNSDEGREGWELVQKLVAESTSHRNNLSGFSNTAGQVIQIMLGGDLTPQETAEMIQKEFERSGL
ncbi:ABC transporter substrate-binding protein [Oceanispirochaeta crateris]|nr:extracellular solute-binding protein [Oceanispirochaeta crateris]